MRWSMQVHASRGPCASLRSSAKLASPVLPPVPMSDARLAILTGTFGEHDFMSKSTWEVEQRRPGRRMLDEGQPCACRWPSAHVECWQHGTRLGCSVPHKRAQNGMLPLSAMSLQTAYVSSTGHAVRVYW